MKLDVKNIEKWFDALNLPSDWKSEALSAARAFDPSSLDAMDNPYAYLAECEDKLDCLLYALYRCDFCAAEYAKLGIPDDIMLASLDEIRIHSVDYNSRMNGEKIGVSQIVWLGKVLTPKIFRLGRLNFELRDAKYDYPKLGVRVGDDVINVHIPKGGSFDSASRAEAYAESEKFFAKYFPKFKYKCYACNSWMLDGELKKFLKPSSNILEFSREFDIVGRVEKYDALTYLFVRGTTLDDLPKLEPKTSLQKGVVEHLKAGGKLYVSYGYRRAES